MLFWIANIKSNFINLNSGSNMANKLLIKLFISAQVKLIVVFGTIITNLNSNFENLK